MEKGVFRFVHEGHLKTFENKNGTKTIGVVRDIDLPCLCSFAVVLNYRHRKGEESKLDYNCQPWWDIEKNPGRDASDSEISQFVKELVLQDSHLARVTIDFNNRTLYMEDEYERDYSKEPVECRF